MRMITADSLKEVGSDLRDALTALVANEGRLPRPTDLSRQWELDQTLCVRTCSALRNQEPLRVLHQLPSTGSLRSIVEAARARGVGADLRRRAEGVIAQLEEAITTLGGKKANLDTLIGSQLVEAREKIEATSKQSIFRGMSNLLGLQSDVVMTTYFVMPSDDSEWCDELAIYGSAGLRRLRPELAILVGGRVLFGEPADDLPRAREVLHGGQLDRSGFSVALKSFSTDPFPEVDVIESGRRLLYTLPGDDAGESHEISMFFASIDRHASPQHRRKDVRDAPFGFLPRNPAKDLLLDVFVHRDVWPGSEPRLRVTRGDNLLTTDGNLRANEIDQLDLCESIQLLGESPRNSQFKPLPQYGEMLDRVREHAGIDAKDYRLHRLHVKYPVISLMYAMDFPLPTRPVTPFYQSSGAR